MKAFALSFLILSLAFIACSDGYEQLMNDNAQTRALTTETTGEKFEFEKTYAINEIPADIYNYVNRDSLDAFIFTYKLQMDSVAFIPLEKFIKKYNNSIIHNKARESDEQRHYITSYYDTDYVKYFDAYAKGSAVRLDIGRYSAAVNIEIEPTSTISPIAIFVVGDIRYSSLNAYYEPCIPVKDSPCEEGVIIDFSLICPVSQYGRINGIVSYKKPVHEYEIWAGGCIPIACGGSVTRIR